MKPTFEELKAIIKNVQEEIKGILSYSSFNPDTIEELDIIDNTLTELRELREENVRLFDLYTQEILKYAGANGGRLQLQAKLDKAKEYMRHKPSCDLGGFACTCSFEQTLKSIEEE